VRDCTQLEIYKLADQFRREIRILVERPSFGSHYSLREQLTNAAEGPCAHIQEGFSRYYPREFARFLSIAKGSASEAIEHLDRAEHCGCITRAEMETLSALARRFRGGCTRLILYLRRAEAPMPGPPRR
jgi:four helix bundle protein